MSADRRVSSVPDGTEKLQNELRRVSDSAISKDHFLFIKEVGRGAFGQVWLCQRNDQLVAIKMVGKNYILEDEDSKARRRKVARLLNERRILQHVEHPFVIRLLYAFQDDAACYFGLEFLSGGDFHALLRREGGGKGLAPRCARYYLAELALALEYLQDNGILHRDLKLENMMLGADGHLVLTDFGTAKYLDPRKRTTSTVGTPAYLAPEVVRTNAYGREVDWWACGVVAYELLSGRPPFDGTDLHTTFKSILTKEPLLPARLVSGAEAKHEATLAQDLVSSLLRKSPSDRLGSSDGAAEVKAHGWFALPISEEGGARAQTVAQALGGGTARLWSWDDLLRKRIAPPFVPTASAPQPSGGGSESAAGGLSPKARAKLFEAFEPFRRTVLIGSGGEEEGAGGGGQRLDQSVLRTVKYVCREGSEEEFDKQLDAVVAAFKARVAGYQYVGFTKPSPREACLTMVFDNEEALDRYRREVKPSLVAIIQATLVTVAAWDVDSKRVLVSPREAAEEDFGSGGADPVVLKMRRDGLIEELAHALGAEGEDVFVEGGRFWGGNGVPRLLDVSKGQVLEGEEEARRYWATNSSAVFSEVAFVLKQKEAVGADKIACSLEMTGRHTEGALFNAIPPRGNKVRLGVVVTVEFEPGSVKFTLLAHSWDVAKIVQQVMRVGPVEVEGGSNGLALSVPPADEGE